MSGWQRLGVVLSVLWAIGFPFWLVHNQNRHADQERTACSEWAFSISERYKDADKSAEVYERMIRDCGRTWLASTHSVYDLLADRQTATFLIGGPIAALWLLGAIIIGTTRWMVRGFSLFSNKRTN